MLPRGRYPACDAGLGAGLACSVDACSQPVPYPPPLLVQCNLAFDRVSLKGSGRKGGGMGSTIGLPMGMLGGLGSDFL